MGAKVGPVDADLNQQWKLRPTGDSAPASARLPTYRRDPLRDFKRVEKRDAQIGKVPNVPGHNS